MNQDIDFIPEPGQILNNNLLILDAIDQGGTSMVILCEDLKTGAKKAIKKFFNEGLTPNLINRIFEEPYLNIDTEYVCKSEYMFVENYHLHSVMPFIEGITLREILTVNDKIEKYLAIYYALILCKASFTLHSTGILCTDIKPENTMIQKGEKVKLIDITCFEKIHQVPEVSQGSQPYCSPELFQRRSLSPSTDVYSIGVMLYEMLMGESIFTLQISQMNSTNSFTMIDITDLYAIYPELYPIIKKAMDPEPMKRFQSTKDLFESLMPFYPMGNSINLTKSNQKIILYSTTGHHIIFEPGHYGLGRDIIDPLNHRISESHFEIDCFGSIVKIKDSGSKNGTFLNGTPINGFWVEIYNGDTIQVGDVFLNICSI